MMETATRDLPRRDVGVAAWRGAKCRCPNCGAGRLYRAYLKVNNNCPECGEALYHHRADDAPPYVVITIVGHIVIGLMLVVEKGYSPSLWLHAAMWLPLTLVLSLALLPPVKGALVGVQWALRMHGFDPNSAEAGESPPAAVAARRG